MTHLIPLGDLVRDGQISYGIVQPGTDGSEGVPIVRVKDVRNGVIDTTQPLRVDAQIAAKHNKTRLRGGELLLSLVGTVGESAVVPEDLAGWNVARAIAVINPVGVSARWLQLCFESAPVRDQVQSRLNTTVQATLNLSDLKTVGIPMPAEPVRRSIEEVMGALDDKIAANTKLAETTGQLARFVYMSMLAGATETPLSKTADFVNGKAFTKGASGTGRVVVRIAELNSGIGGSTVYSDAEVEDRYTARAGDLLFAWSGSLTLHRWFREDAIINQHIFKVIPRDDYPLWLVDQLLQSKIEHFKAVAADKATTMGHIQRRHLDEPVLVPSQDTIQANSVLMEGLWNLGLLAEQENEKLAATRDTLLPQLMSGKLRVKDIENTMGEMV